MEGTHSGAGEKCEKEGVAEHNCYKLTIDPLLPIPSVLLRE